MSIHLVNMRRSKKERKAGSSHEVAFEEPAIPSGLTIRLDDESLDKLGFKDLPNVGDRMVVAAIGTVSLVSQHDSKRNEKRNKNRDVSIELDKLDVSPVPTSKIKSAEDAIGEAIKEI